MKTDKFLTAVEVASLAGLTPATIRRYARDGVMPAPVILRPGRKPRLRWQALEVREWLGGLGGRVRWGDGRHAVGSEARERIGALAGVTCDGQRGR